MKRLKIFVLFLICSVSVLAFQLEGISFNKSLEDGYKEFTITNDGFGKQRYKISILPSDRNEDISDCLEVSPKIVTIEPQDSAKFKIFGTAKRKLEKKEYSFLVNFNPIVIPTLSKSDGKTISGTGAAALVPIVEMSGHGGKIDYSKYITLTDIQEIEDKNGRKLLKMKLNNNSYGAVDGGMIIYNKDNQAFTSAPFGTLRANEKKDFVLGMQGRSISEIDRIEIVDEEFNILKTLNSEELKSFISK